MATENIIKILVLEKISPIAIDTFKKQGYQVETADSLTEEELIKKVENIHVLCIRSKTKITKKIVDAATKSGNLAIIATFCIGTDQIEDLQYVTSKGICVFNCLFGNTRSVAELVIGEMIMLARQTFTRSVECHQGVWSKTSSNCFEIRGKTVAIIGYGNVGSQVSILAEALGMRVQFYDTVSKLALGTATCKSSLVEAIQDADFVTLHVPGGKETENLIDFKEVECMKKGSYLINASRGTVVNLEAVKQALQCHKLLGAAIDVFQIEPENNRQPFECCLQGLYNVILTPHLGGSTEEAQTNIAIDVSNKIVQYLKHGTTLGAVNLPELSSNLTSKTHRICNIHHNEPGVLRDINNVLADYNISTQLLQTQGEIGYLIIDVDHTMSAEIKDKIANLKSNIKTRIL